MTATAPLRSQSSYFWLCLALSATVFYGFTMPGPVTAPKSLQAFLLVERDDFNEIGKRHEA